MDKWRSSSRGMLVASPASEVVDFLVELRLLELFVCFREEEEEEMEGEGELAVFFLLERVGVSEKSLAVSDAAFVVSVTALLTTLKKFFMVVDSLVVLHSHLFSHTNTVSS